MSEQFCLRWNNHQSTLISVFENLLESGSLIDCTLCAEGQLLKAHKVVLSACSPTFESMLCIQEDKHPIIFLKDVRFIELKAMIDYMYKGEVNILQDQLDSFLKTAAALQIKGLTDQGGGGGDEPPAKKGPGRKTGMSDVAPESPLVGNAPLREGSMSPTRRRRRLPRRPSSAEDASADNSSCDIPPPATAPNVLPASTPNPLPASDSSPAPRLSVKKTEPLDPPLITPKQEMLDEPAEDIEDLTLDDDDDYNDAMSDMSKPGTSFGAMAPGNTSQDFSQWQQMMGAADRSGQDEVFMAAQEAINNQSNTQDSSNLSRIQTFRETEIEDAIEDVKEEILHNAHTESKMEELTSDQLEPRLGSPHCSSTDVFMSQIIKQDETAALPSGHRGNVESQYSPYDSAESTSSFYPQETLSGVVSSKTTQDKPHGCILCNYRCQYKSQLERHLRIHTGEKPFSCEFCDYVCSQAERLKVHMRIHTGEKPFACGLCDFKCGTATNLKVHLKSHTTSNPYSYSQREKTVCCPKCDYKCVLQSHLKKHVLIHAEEKPFACQVCDYRCCRRQQLKCHMRTHTGEKPFTCNFCDYACSQIERLKRHLRTHTTEQPYSCSLCDYTCSRSNHLKAHMKIHTTEQNYACIHCDYKSTQSSDFQVHLKMMHNYQLQDGTCVESSVQ